MKPIGLGAGLGTQAQIAYREPAGKQTFPGPAVQGAQVCTFFSLPRRAH
ncbi:MAG: hypothetical protein AAF384_14355 [Pseudomonadota bacterium]